MTNLSMRFKLELDLQFRITFHQILHQYNDVYSTLIWRHHPNKGCACLVVPTRWGGPIFGIWMIFLPTPPPPPPPPNLTMSTILFRSCRVPFLSPPFSACRRSFCPSKLTKSIILISSCWGPFWTASGAPLLIFTRSARSHGAWPLNHPNPGMQSRNIKEHRDIPSAYSDRHMKRARPRKTKRLTPLTSCQQSMRAIMRLPLTQCDITYKRKICSQIFNSCNLTNINDPT